jgi:hypothetical protein
MSVVRKPVLWASLWLSATAIGVMVNLSGVSLLRHSTQEEPPLVAIPYATEPETVTVTRSVSPSLTTSTQDSSVAATPQAPGKPTDRRSDLPKPSPSHAIVTPTPSSSPHLTSQDVDD